MKRMGNLLISLLLALGLSTSFTSCAADSSSDSKKDVNPGSQSSNLETYWYKGTNFYHIWVKSFYDSNGDGIGDINGVKNKLDYIKETLGCDGVWLSPVFDCEGKGSIMHGYDTTNYYEINDKFGTKSDLAALITACHEKGMKIIFDFVPNHTAKSNPWFINSQKKQTVDGIDYTDWYVWSKTSRTASTNMGSSSYYKDATRNEYYYAAFGESVPDLNFSNTHVREELKKIIKYWMDFGFDGMRADAVRYLYDDVANSKYMDTAQSHGIFAEWRELLDSYEVPKFMMCEAWIEDDRDTLEKYLGTEAKPEFNMVLDFFQGKVCYNSVLENKDNFVIGTNFKANCTSSVTGAGYASFLTNHDQYTDRIGTVFNRDPYAMAQATALSLMRANVAIIYYGQEIGAKSTDVGGDTALRGSYDWSEEASQAADEHSLLKLNNALLKVRSTYKDAFANGTVRKLTSSDNSKLAYTIVFGDTKILCVYNLSENGATSTKFTNSSLGTVSAYSTLIGDIDDSTLTVSSGNVTVTNLAPYAYRVYLIGSDTAANLFDNETYSASHEVNHRVAYDNMYIRGDMNSWGADEMDPDENHSIFTLTKNLSAGTYNFKFAAHITSWEAKNWGAKYASMTYPADTAFTAITGTDKNLSIKITTAGNYTIKFDTHNGTVYVLSAGSSESTAENNVVYLRGDISGWEDYKGIAMAKQSDGTYSVKFTPTAGTYSFKICKAPNSWTNQWGAAGTGTVTLGTPMATSGSDKSGNFTVTLAAKATTFTLDPTANTITVSQ